MFLHRTLRRFTVISRSAYSRPSSIRYHWKWASTTPTSIPLSSGQLPDRAQHFQQQVWDCSISGSSTGLRDAYLNLSTAATNGTWLQSKMEGTVLKPVDFHDALAILAATGEAIDLHFVDQILSDMPRLFGMPVTLETHSVILRALGRRPNIEVIYRWIMAMEKKAGRIRPTLEHWHIFFENCLLHSSLPRMWRALPAMRTAGCLPTNATYKLLVRGIFKMPSDMHLSWASRITKETIRSRLSFDDTLLTMIVEGFTNQGLPDRAADVESVYRERNTRTTPSAFWKLERNWNIQLGETLLAHGKAAAIQLYQSFRSRGFVASSTTLTTLLGHSYQVQDLASLENELNVKAGPSAWLTLIKNAPTTRLPVVALNVYREARAADISGSLLAEPVIRALCSSSLREPDETSIDQALDIYRDIRLQDIPERWATRTTAQVSLYHTLLRTLVSASNHAKYFPVALEILEDMRERRVSKDGTTTASTAVTLVRASASVEEALQVYKAIHTHIHAPLDAAGYRAVLTALIELPFGDQIVHITREYFHIVKDMRDAGYPTSPDVYTLVFRRIARIAIYLDSSSPDFYERLRRLLISARYAHHLLTIDASVSPDTRCWNQLIETYQRAGSFEDSRRVWDSLYLSGKVDDSSIGIVLGACGRAGAARTAIDVYQKLRADGYRLTQENWHTWLECLCRAGHLDEATRQLCVEMVKSPDNVEPDVESVRILIKSAPEPAAEEVRKRIQRYLPSLWALLPRELTGSQ